MPLAVRVTDPNGTPVAAIEVRWRVTTGSGGLWPLWILDPQHQPVPVSEITRLTGEDGISRPAWWRLGPEVGEQRVEVSVPGAEPMTWSVEATPGVILVALWTLSPEQQARLPSDTLRIHATNHLTYVDVAIRRLEQREPAQRIDVRGPVLCTGKLELVGIEPVPATYLERLRTTRAGSGA